jgi:hypothetical protein
MGSLPDPVLVLSPSAGGTSPVADKPVRRPLRYAVILDSDSMEEWQAGVVDKLSESGNAQLVALIHPERTGEPPRFSTAEVFRHFVYFLMRLTFWRPKFFRRRPLPKDWAGAPRVRCRVERKGKFSDYVVDEDVEKIRRLDVDFILKFGLRILRGSVLSAPRYGVWSFHHGDERQVRGRPAGFWEIYHGWPTTGVVLQRLTERLDGGVILKRGVLGTVPYSYMSTLDRIYRQGADFPSLVCADILRGDAAYLTAAPSPTTAPVYKNPSNGQALFCLVRMAWAIFARVLYGAFRLKVWGIGLIRGSVESVLSPTALPKVRWLTARARNSFVADPFLVEGTRGRTWLFYEHLNYGTLKGRIGCVEVGDESFDLDAHAALTEKHHLSFPCAFRHEGAIYCVPEEARSGTVRLFKFDEETRTLAEAATLIRGIHAVDPAVFQHGGLWWIACINAEWGGERLMLWHSPSLFGPYVQHESNPVMIDVRLARAAGRPFAWEGKTYRPVQDSSGGYGKRVNIQEIVRLDPKGFEERTAASITAFDRAFSKGLHQLSTAGGWTVIDGYREVFHPLAWFFRLKSKLQGSGAVSCR